jgi:hypothetical protein
MILAAAACAEGQGDAPRELRWVFEHDRWKVLPNAGGLLDQPAGALRRMTACENAYRALRFYSEHGPEPGQSAAWKDEHTDIWTLVQQINDLRENPHGE